MNNVVSIETFRNEEAIKHLYDISELLDNHKDSKSRGALEWIDSMIEKLENME